MSKHNQKSAFRPLVSIVIPSYLRFDLLQQCLDAIPAGMGDIPYEVILVENGSPKEQAQEFSGSAKLPPNTRVLWLHKNVGFPGAVNAGLRKATAPLLFILTNDVILHPGSVEKLVLDMDDPEIGLAGMKLLFPTSAQLDKAGLVHDAGRRPAGRVQHIGLFTNLRAQVIHMYLGWSEDNPRVNALREVLAVTGAAFMTRTALFRKAGGMDEGYGAGTWEDVDYAMFVHSQNLKVVVNPLAVAVHYTGATAEKANIAFPLGANEVRFKQKWYNNLIWTEWMAW